MNPEQPIISPEPKNNRPLIIGLIGGGILLIGLVIGVVALMNGSSDPKKTTTTTSEFQNWLKPSSEIKIAKYRYVSACSVLSPSAVEATFGKLSPNTVIQEDYLDQSIPDPNPNEVNMNCSYNHVSGDGPDVRLETSQYEDAADAKQLSRSVGALVRPDDIQAELDLYSKALKAKPNADAKKFLDKLTTSFDTFKKYQKVYDEDELASLNLKNFVLPVSDTLAGSGNDFAFVGIHDNVFWTVGHTPASRKGLNDLSKYSDQELVSELLSMQKATNTVVSNLNNKSLDQSPAPTIIGKTDTYGSTKLLEPCAVMTPSVFTAITGGKVQNNPVDRTSASVDFTAKRYTKIDKTLILPRNDCSRQASEPVDVIHDNNTYATFEINYGNSVEGAKKYLANDFTVGPNDVALQTDADWAMSFANPIETDAYKPVVMFRVGPYVGNINIYSATYDGGSTDAPQEQYVQAINALTASLKQNIAKAK